MAKKKTGGKLGIGGGLQSTRLGKFSPPIKDNGVWKYPTAYLTNVEAIEQEIKNGDRAGQTETVLRMDFSDKPKGQAAKKGFRVVFWPVSNDDAEKEQAQIEVVQGQIKHIFDQYKTLGEDEYLGSGDTWAELFTSIAEEFNTGNDGQPVYGQIPTWLKLTFYRDNLQLPRYPNFIEKKGQVAFPQTLSVNLQYDKVEQEANTDPTGGGGAVSSPDDFPA